MFLADPRTAACVSRDAPDRLMEEGLLACTNGKVDSAALVPWLEASLTRSSTTVAASQPPSRAGTAAISAPKSQGLSAGIASRGYRRASSFLAIDHAIMSQLHVRRATCGPTRS